MFENKILERFSTNEEQIWWQDHENEKILSQEVFDASCCRKNERFISTKSFHLLELVLAYASI